MAVTRTVRPSFIVAGTLVGLRDKFSRNSGQRYAREVTIEQDSGARLAIDIFDRQDEAPVPLPGRDEPFACVATLSESQQYGASLSYEGPITDTELDALTASMPALAGK